MPNEVERTEILKMVQNKQITPEDGARLLKALPPTQVAAAPLRPPVPGVNPESRWLKLIVDEIGGQHVNLQLPLGAVPTMLRFVQRWIPEEYRESVQSASDALTNGFRGEIFRAEEPGGPRVRIWIE